ncbi:MAG TPA: cyclic nucleotide-gated ion channel [Stellaceae bacterium]|jgi:voltage-gated potassium channel|nr:cyclic nucleotide-gated ion channel [Stellaceae bacterium]
MDRRRLYRLLDPESSHPDARRFRLLHHALIAIGITIMLADTVAELQQQYWVPLVTGFLVVATLFFGECVLRLIVAPEAPGQEHHSAWRARLNWAGSLGGVLDLVSALPALLALIDREPAMLLSGVWIFKYIRYSPGLASLRRVITNAEQSLLSVLLGFIIILLTAATLSYLLERDANPQAFGSIPAALWWAIVTLTTTGYGDVVPVTTAGRALAGVVMVSGILVFALWAGILAAGYAQEMRRLQFLRTWELVARVPFFHDIGAALIAEVARLLRAREFPAGAVIVRRGEIGDCMFFIVEGEVEIEVSPAPVTLGVGNFFGELALLTRAPRNASVVAREPCTLLVLDIVDFHELFGRHPELARVIREEAAKRMIPQPQPEPEPGRMPEPLMTEDAED